jgi:alpha-amylase/alpha-mannosidase (GH57 family)
MQLDSNWHIEYDTNNIVLISTIHNAGNKKPTVTPYYYPTLKMALKNYLNRSLSGSKDIKEVISRIESVEKLIKNI